jgi:hypothetical protein
VKIVYTAEKVDEVTSYERDEEALYDDREYELSAFSFYQH